MGPCQTGEQDIERDTRGIELSRSAAMPHRWTGSSVSKFGSWPRLMRAATAAAYCDEKSIQSFRRGVGTLYPYAIRISGKGERWLKEDLDVAIERIGGKQPAVFDAATVLDAT